MSTDPGELPSSGEFVRFTLKELLGQQLNKLDRIEQMVSEMAKTKAEVTTVVDLERRINHFEKQEALGVEVLAQFRAAQKEIAENRDNIETLQKNSASLSAVTSYRRWLVGIVIGSTASILATLAFVITHLKP